MALTELIKCNKHMHVVYYFPYGVKKDFLYPIILIPIVALDQSLDITLYYSYNINVIINLHKNN